MNQNIGINNFNGFGFAEPQSGNSQFTFGGTDMGMGSLGKKQSQPGSSSNSFDLI